jgi:hypothetical protein
MVNHKQEIEAEASNLLTQTKLPAFSGALAMRESAVWYTKVGVKSSETAHLLEVRRDSFTSILICHESRVTCSHANTVQ